MIVYVDSSVALRIALGSDGALDGWQQWSPAVSSGLIEVECLRTLDRLRLAGSIDDALLARRREWMYGFLAGLEIVEVSQTVLSRAALPLPVPLRTLDAIHLATAMLWREAEEAELTMATHDAALALAARAMGFRVLGA